MKTQTDGMMQCQDKLLFAWLPQLGPVLGWTRRDDNEDCHIGRVWAKADDLYTSASPIAAVTAVWDKRGDKAILIGDSIRFWRTRTFTLPATQVVQHFAVADVPFKEWSETRVMRMAFIHAVPIATADNKPPNHEPADDDLALTDPAPYEPPFCNGTPPQELVEQWFSKLESALKTRERNSRKPIPDTLSRERRRTASMQDCEIAWRPPSHQKGDMLRIVAGSCRYPGMTFDEERMDRALADITSLRGSGTAPDLMFMLGDQIYADATAGVFDVQAGPGREANTKSSRGLGVGRFTSRYDAAFGTTHFRRLTAAVPTYMLADDHEIRDGWPNDTPPGPAPRPKHWDDAAEWGHRLFVSHQRLHGPNPPRALAPAQGRTPLCFSFEAAGVPFFAFDARFQRLPNRAQIVGREQLAAFRCWLDDVVALERARPSEWLHVPKFIVSGSVFAPGLGEFANDNECARRADNWQAFPEERAMVAELIAQSGTENVVFLSGDYHCSAVGRMEFCRDGKPVSCGHMIVVPPLYAPFPFANATPADISKRDRICLPANGRIVARYHAEPFPFPVEGFALITVSRRASTGSAHDWSIAVRIQGEKLTGTSTLAADLPLTWEVENA